MPNMAKKLLKRSSRTRMAKPGEMIWDVVKWIMALGGSILAVFIGITVQGFSNRVESIDRKTESFFAATLTRMDKIGNDSGSALAEVKVLSVRVETISDLANRINAIESRLNSLSSNKK